MKRQDRLRMFAGPNGSGKSTLVYEIPKMAPSVDLGVILNADEILKLLLDTSTLHLADYGLRIRSDLWATYLAQGGDRGTGLTTALCSLTQNVFHVADAGDSNPYIAAIITDFLREQLLAEQRPFSFETVMSHPSKIDFMEQAQRQGYRTYLYFVTTMSPDINVDRVAQRVGEGGHPVPEEKTRQRYDRTMKLLPEALKHARRAYLFDNTKTMRLVAEKTPENQLLYFDPVVPQWLVESVFQPCDWLTTQLIPRKTNGES
jgi:predicted ABC-type ATPase